jgi:hypothetical protein
MITKLKYNHKNLLKLEKKQMKKCKRCGWYKINCARTIDMKGCIDDDHYYFIWKIWLWFKIMYWKIRKKKNEK